MENQKKEEVKYNNISKSELDESFEEVHKLKEIELKNKIELNEIAQRIQSLQLGEDIKKKNNIHKKEDKEVSEALLFKLRNKVKDIEFKNQHLIDRIKLKEKKIELLRNKQLESLNKWTNEVRKSAQDMKLQSERYNEQWTANASKLAEMYAYINKKR